MQLGLDMLELVTMVVVGFGAFIAMAALVAVPARLIQQRADFELRRPDRDEAERMIREWLSARR